jgi:hypothetical protein
LNCGHFEYLVHELEPESWNHPVTNTPYSGGPEGTVAECSNGSNTTRSIRVSPGALRWWSCGANCLKLEPHNLAWSLASGHKSKYDSLESYIQSGMQPPDWAARKSTICVKRGLQDQHIAQTSACKLRVGQGSGSGSESGRD